MAVFNRMSMWLCIACIIHLNVISSKISKTLNCNIQRRLPELFAVCFIHAIADKVFIIGRHMMFLCYTLLSINKILPFRIQFLLTIAIYSIFFKLFLLLLQYSCRTVKPLPLKYHNKNDYTLSSQFRTRMLYFA